MTEPVPWQPEVALKQRLDALGNPLPIGLVMRRKAASGEFEYRAATPEEQFEWCKDDAW